MRSLSKSDYTARRRDERLHCRAREHGDIVSATAVIVPASNGGASATWHRSGAAAATQVLSRHRSYAARAGGSAATPVATRGCLWSFLGATVRRTRTFRIGYGQHRRPKPAPWTPTSSCRGATNVFATPPFARCPEWVASRGRCCGTTRLLELLRDPVTEDLPASLEDWYANVFWVQRRKCLLVTYAGTLFSAFAPAVRAANLRPLGPFVAPLITHQLLAEGFPADALGPLDPAQATIVKTADRQVLGCMTTWPSSASAPPQTRAASPGSTSRSCTSACSATSPPRVTMSRRSTYSRTRSSSRAGWTRTPQLTRKEKHEPGPATSDTSPPLTGSVQIRPSPTRKHEPALAGTS